MCKITANKAVTNVVRWKNKIYKDKKTHKCLWVSLSCTVTFACSLCWDIQKGNNNALPSMSCASLVNVINKAHTETGTEGAAGDSLWEYATDPHHSRGFGFHSHIPDKVPTCKHKRNDVPVICFYRFFHHWKAEVLQNSGLSTRCKQKWAKSIKKNIPWEAHSPQGGAAWEDRCSCSCTFSQAPLQIPRTHRTTHSARPQPDSKTRKTQWSFVY